MIDFFFTAMARVRSLAGSCQYQAMMREAKDAVGKYPIQYLVISPEMHREIVWIHGERDCVKREVVIPDPVLNVYKPTDHVPVHISRGWQGKKWELCSKDRFDEIFRHEKALSSNNQNVV